MKYTYKPSGVCSQEFIFEIEENVIKSFEAYGGCNGNLKGIAALLNGLDVNDAINKLKGITCGYKNTSCPDQISKALEKYILENK